MLWETVGMDTFFFTCFRSSNTRRTTRVVGLPSWRELIEQSLPKQLTESLLQLMIEPRTELLKSPLESLLSLDKRHWPNLYLSLCTQKSIYYDGFCICFYTAFWNVMQMRLMWTRRFGTRTHLQSSCGPQNDLAGHIWLSTVQEFEMLYK